MQITLIKKQNLITPFTLLKLEKIVIYFLLIYWIFHFYFREIFLLYMSCVVIRKELYLEIKFFLMHRLIELFWLCKFYLLLYTGQLI